MTTTTGVTCIEFWSEPQTSELTMPDGTVLVCVWVAANPDDPEIQIRSLVEVDSPDRQVRGETLGDHVTTLLEADARQLLGPSRDDLLKLWIRVCEYRDTAEITCPETIYQTDQCQQDAAQFMERCLEVVGYGELDDEGLTYVSPGL